MYKLKVMKVKVCLYARVSKALDQNPENQLIELRRWAANADAVVVGEFVDEISSRDTRPQKEAVLRKLRLGEVDGVVFWSLDRWGRSMSELVFELEEFGASGRKLISLREGLDLSTSAGRLYANVLAAMANFERDRIRERTMLGLARAKSQGKKLGRPKTLDTEKMALMQSQGATNASIAKELGVSRTAVWKALRVNKTPPVNPVILIPASIDINKTTV